jgi:hypothetical protein
LVYLLVFLFPNSYTILFWEFYFLPFSVRYAQKNITTSYTCNYTYCSIQRLVAAHWPPVALPRRMTNCRHSCTIVCPYCNIGNRGLCNSSIFVCFL